MLRSWRPSVWRSRREGGEKRKREGCNSKEKLSSRRKRQQRGLQPGPLLKATSLILCHPSSQHSTKMDSSMIQLKEVEFHLYLSKY